MYLILYRPIICLAIVILYYIQVYYPFYILEYSPQYSSYTECMDFIQILCFTPKAQQNLFFFQEFLSHSVFGFTMHVIWQNHMSRTYKITCPVHGASLFFHQDIACDIWISSVIYFLATRTCFLSRRLFQPSHRSIIRILIYSYRFQRVMC